MTCVPLPFYETIVMYTYIVIGRIISSMPAVYRQTRTIIQFNYIKMVKTRRMNKVIKSLKSEKIKKNEKIKKSNGNPSTSIEDLLKLCKPFTIRLIRIVHIPKHESKF